MASKKNTFNIFLTFLILHLAIWTLIPTISNLNLPLDTIEALAWGSELNWGYNKHPPIILRSAFIAESADASPAKKYISPCTMRASAQYILPPKNPCVLTSPQHCFKMQNP
mgnify:CR=1 FL=1